MPSERVQRRIDRLLDDAEQAMDQRDWTLEQSLAREVLSLDPENGDGATFLAAAERMLPSGAAAAERQTPFAPGDTAQSSDSPPRDDPQPASFANGRYAVKRFLGEGGKKKVYLAHDTLLDRDVAFALIKTEGLDEVGRDRITREAQAI